MKTEEKERFLSGMPNERRKLMEALFEKVQTRTWTALGMIRFRNADELKDRMESKMLCKNRGIGTKGYNQLCDFFNEPSWKIGKRKLCPHCGKELP